MMDDIGKKDISKSNNKTQDMDLISEKIILKKQFSDSKSELFNEIGRLEARYDYTIKVIKENYQKQISETQDKCAKKYHSKLEEKRNQIVVEIKELEEEINNNIKALDIQEEKIIKSIKEIYRRESKELRKKILKLIDLKF